MNMWATAKAFTRDDLRKAFDEYAEAHGAELATLALERSTGARQVSLAPESRIINGMVELIGGYSFVGQSMLPRAQGVAERLSNLHGSLTAIRYEAFAARSGKTAN